MSTINVLGSVNWQHSFVKTEYSVANSLFLKKIFRQEATENWFFGGMVSPHLRLLTTVFRVS